MTSFVQDIIPAQQQYTALFHCPCEISSWEVTCSKHMMLPVTIVCWLKQPAPCLRLLLAVRGNKMLQTSDWKPSLTKPQLPVKDVYSPSNIANNELHPWWRGSKWPALLYTRIFICNCESVFFFFFFSNGSETPRMHCHCAGPASLPVVWEASGRPGAQCQSGSQTDQTLLLPWQCRSSVNTRDTEGD